MNNNCQLMYSSLCRNFEVNGKKLEVLIYKDVAVEWFLELVDNLGNSIICDEMFASDELALKYSDVMINAISRLSSNCG